MKISILTFIVLTVFASVSFASTASVIWMTITPGARPNGMGEAFTALANDATASYWNPAGLAFVDSTKQEMTLQHSNWLPQLADDLYYEYLGYANYIEGWGGVGGNITFMSMGEQQETTEEGQQLGTFYSYGVAVTGSFGTEVAPGVSVGLGLKFIYDHLYYKDSGKG
ncbi:MAG: PorV/PorQ family protein, partial [Candidatus Aegiribacteria sp.]|nr:PorV/PorQ family protein [Candidatus Aegiribacteria sp.]